MSAAHDIRDDPNNIGIPRLPSDIDIEQALLGILIVRNDQIDECQAECTAADFYDPLHRRIATGIYSVHEQRRPVTPLTIKAELGADKGLEECGGHGYLANLAQGAPNERAVHHARAVASLAVRRSVMIAALDIVETIGRPAEAVSSVLAPMLRIADRAAERASGASHTGSVGDAVGAALARYDMPEGQAAGVSTGLHKLDEVLGTLEPGKLYVIAARPGMGKSTLGTNLARSIAQAGERVDFYSIEMSKRSLGARFIADFDYDANHEHPLHYSRLLKRRISQVELERAVMLRGAMDALPLHIDDRDTITMSQIGALSRARVSRLGPLGLLIIDHLHIVQPEDRYRGFRTQEIEENTHAAKRLS